MIKFKALTIAIVLSSLLFHSNYLLAADCPYDKFALWTGKHLHGANIFMGRNPDGASNGIGDGDFTQADFNDLRQAGANYVQLSHAGIFNEAAPYSLDSVAEANLDLSIQRAMAAGLYAVIAFRSGPGRNENAISNRDALLVEEIWTNAAARNAWVNMLKRTASRYNGNPAVVGYSIMVEPNSYAHHNYPSPEDFYAQYAGTLEDVNGLFALATAAIREVDSTTPILLEPEGYGNIDWLSYLNLTSDSRTVYTPHDYTPYEYTHEAVGGATYPGNYDLDSDGTTEVVNKNFLTTYLSRVSQFATTNSVPVAITEFGVHTSASNAATFLSDRIDIQNAIGSWAVWTWQPSGFDDPFSVHDSSSVHDALTSAWSNNCTPIFEQPTTNPGMLIGKSYYRSSKKPLKGVKISAGTSSATSGIDGSYAITLPAGSYLVSATSKKKKQRCRISSLRGRKSVSTTIASDLTNTINFYCTKR